MAAPKRDVIFETIWAGVMAGIVMEGKRVCMEPSVNDAQVFESARGDEGTGSSSACRSLTAGSHRANEQRQREQSPGDHHEDQNDFAEPRQLRRDAEGEGVGTGGAGGFEEDFDEGVGLEECEEE